MRAFRIDNRQYAQGAIIPPQDLYQGQLDEGRAEVERILEENRPKDLPRRNEILMLFAQFDDAKKHWTIQKDAKFYRVDIEEGNILHIGDYNKVEELYRNLANPVRAKEIAIEYWNGETTDNPRLELFVREAPVSYILSHDEDERKNAYRMRGGIAPKQGVRIINDID